MLHKIMYHLGYLTNTARHRYKETFWGAPYHQGRVDAASDSGARRVLERVGFASGTPKPREVLQWLEDHADDSPAASGE